jgi:hypothetical protein
LVNLDLNDEQEIQVFHIVQEALANTAKHSMARHAVVSIDRTAAGLEFCIEDDGLGMAVPSCLDHCGNGQGNGQFQAIWVWRSCAVAPNAWAAAWKSAPTRAVAPACRLLIPVKGFVPYTASMSMSIRVMLVDDHALCRSGLTELLIHRGHMQGGRSHRKS